MNVVSYRVKKGVGGDLYWQKCIVLWPVFEHFERKNKKVFRPKPRGMATQRVREAWWGLWNVYIWKANFIFPRTRVKSESGVTSGFRFCSKGTLGCSGPEKPWTAWDICRQQREGEDSVRALWLDLIQWLATVCMDGGTGVGERKKGNCAGDRILSVLLTLAPSTHSLTKYLLCAVAQEPCQWTKQVKMPALWAEILAWSVGGEKDTNKRQ